MPIERERESKRDLILRYTSFASILIYFYPSQMGLRDYNPFLHERGFHQKLNLLVKESLQFGYLSSTLP